MKLIALIISISLFSSAFSAVKNGEKAPNFKLMDSMCKEVSLDQFNGKEVVLEWLNHGCPFVKKHYNTGNMQKLQKEAKDDGVVWLSVISSAPGKQGHSTPAKAETDRKQKS